MPQKSCDDSLARGAAPRAAEEGEDGGGQQQRVRGAALEGPEDAPAHLPVGRDVPVSI